MTVEVKSRRRARHLTSAAGEQLVDRVALRICGG
jgi:hypothetical protein